MNVSILQRLTVRRRLPIQSRPGQRAVLRTGSFKPARWLEAMAPALRGDSL